MNYSNQPDQRQAAEGSNPPQQSLASCGGKQPNCHQLDSGRAAAVARGACGTNTPSRPVQTPTSPRAVSDREHRREEQAVKCPVSSLHTLAHQLRAPRAILHQWQHVTRAVTQPSIRTIQSCIPQRSPVGLSPHCPHSCQLNKEAPYRGVSPSSPASLSRTPHRWGSLLIK